MTPALKRAVAAAACLLGAACADNLTDSALSTELGAAFNTLPAGYSSNTSSFAGSADGNTDFGPHRGHGGPGHGFGGGLMGGGLAGLFVGGGFDAGFGHGRHGDPVLDGSSCAFNASTSRVECSAVTRDSLTVKRSAQYRDAAGNVQQAFDSVTTNSINTQVTVSGTHSRRNGGTSTVQSASDRTVTGVAKGSTRRTVNGTSSGTENGAGSDSTGAYTFSRVAGDTVVNVVVPVPTSDTARVYPVSGTVTRSMKVTVTYSGKSPTTTTRREVVTYDGSSTAKVVVTRDGTTQTCTVPLPRGRPTCQ